MKSTSMRLAGLCFLCLIWSQCKEVPKFNKPTKTGQIKEIKADDGKDEDAEAAQQQALEPVAIGGAYLACQYEVEPANGEVWCRLEENGEPRLVESQPSLENWVIAQDDVAFDASPYNLDASSGWQWAIKIPKATTLSVVLDIMIDGMPYHFATTISSIAPDNSGPGKASPPPAATPQGRRYAYGNAASFVVDTNPYSTSAPESCYPAPTAAPDPLLPDLHFFVKAQKFTFPFLVFKEDSTVTITLDEVCGQMRPIHFADIRGPNNATIRVPIQVGARKVVVIKSQALPVGYYELQVLFEPRSQADLETPERFAFGKVILESSQQLQPGFAFAN